MTTITQNPRGFLQLTEQERESEINKLRMQKFAAEQAGNIALAAALQIAIDQFANTQGAKEIRSQISRLPSDKKMVLTRLLFGTKSKGTPAFTKQGHQLYAEDGIKNGSRIYVVTPQGDIPAPDGTMELDSGEVLEIKDGVITSVSNKLAQLANMLKKIRQQSEAKKSNTARVIKYTKLTTQDYIRLGKIKLPAKPSA